MFSMNDAIYSNMLPCYGESLLSLSDPLIVLYGIPFTKWRAVQRFHNAVDVYLDRTYPSGGKLIPVIETESSVPLFKRVA